MSRTGGLLVTALLSLYLISGGGKGYSIDGAFSFEMAKSVYLDPDHAYFQRFKTAFARWGALMPAIGQPFVVVGAGLARIAPERDSLIVEGHTFRVEEWPVVSAGAIRPGPQLESDAGPIDALALVSFIANGLGVENGATVAEVRMWNGDQMVTVAIRAGIETAEWAYDRPDVRGRAKHARARLAGHWIGQPQGNLYYAQVSLPALPRITRWELVGTPSGIAGAEWQVRAAAFRQSGEWRDVHTDQRYWSERETRDFFTHFAYSTVNAFTTAASAGLVYAIAGSLGFDGTTRVVTALGYGALTLAWPYAKLDFSEPASTAFSLLAIWALVRAFPPHDAVPTPSGGRTLALGFVAAAGLLLSVAGKYTAALAALAVAAQWALSSSWWRRHDRRRSFLFIAALAAPAAVLGIAGIGVMALFAGETPVVFRNAAERLREDWLALPLWTGLRGLVFSPGKSLFIYAPWLLLALPGGVLLWRRVGPHAAVFTLFPAAVVVLYGMKLVWHGGGWGPRYLVPLVPLMSLAAAPAIEACLGRRAWRPVLGTLAAVSLAVQLVGVSKDPEVFPSMVREHVVRGLPELGSQLGGKDYWVARGGAGLARALVDPTHPSGSRGLGYVWGYPTAEIEIGVAEARTFDLSLYAVDWDHAQRRETISVIDALGQREWALDRDFGDGVWGRWQVTGSPAQPVRIGLIQRAADTAVISAIAFDPARGERAGAPAVDTQTRGDWLGRYGSDGYTLFAWHSFNVDSARRPPYAPRLEVTHVGDKPDPRIHVETAEQDLLDTPLLYAAPFSPVLGNAWLLAADAAHLALPSRPQITQAILARPPWVWAGIQAPRLERPEYGLGLDFWPTLLYTSYASHRAVLIGGGLALLALEALFLTSSACLLPHAWRRRGVAALATSLVLFDWLQLQP